MRTLPLAEVERLITLPKNLADPARDLAELQRRPRMERDELWERLRGISQRYRQLLETCAPDPYLEAYLVLAQLKLAAAAQRLGEPTPPGGGFPGVAFRLLEQMEDFCLFDRLTPEQIAGGWDEPGANLGDIARQAAVMGLHLTTDIAGDPTLPGPLAFAFHRIYRRRLARAQQVARLYLERHGLPALVKEVERTCPGCQRLLLDPDHIRALSQASLEVLIALAPPQQARLLAEVARLKVMQGMTKEQVLAVIGERQPLALEALKEMVAGAAAAGKLELYERLLQEVKEGAGRQAEDARLAIDRFTGLFERSLEAVKQTAWALSPRNAPCPNCGANLG
jgi:hypothetical protein